MKRKVKGLVFGFVYGLIFLSIANSKVSAGDTNEKLFDGTISGSMTLASDYVFRGESETFDGEVPAIQGTLSWNHDSGWYLGVFGSNVKFEDPNLEVVIGPFAGKTGPVGFAGLNYDVMVFAYLYPGASYSNYTELWIRINKQFNKAKLEFEITPTLDDWFGEEGWRGINFALHPSYALDEGLNFSGSIGYQHLEGAGAESWTHWNLGVSKQVIGLTFDLRYHGSNIDESHLVYGSPNGQKIFDDRVVIGVTKYF
jgi:uncharacterized protein (TIGR02001 family)